MSIEPTAAQRTSIEQLDRCFAVLDESKRRFAATTVAQRIALLERCADGVAKVAREWVARACRLKAIPPGSPFRAEEVFAGPVAALRCVRLLIHSLRGIAATGVPTLPGRAAWGTDGRLRVPLLPTGALYDRIALLPFRATAWMHSGIDLDNLSQHLAACYREGASRPERTVVVLGAGNVSAIPVTDTLAKLFQESSVVLLKMSPVNEVLGPLFEEALRPLVDAGHLRIVYGGEDVGAAAVADPRADAVHITGSIHSHDRIVWGPQGAARDRRLAANTPLLEKPITSELGNVSPWIFLPGRYTDRQIAFQAENIAASVSNNVSFNCVATKVLVTWKRWPQRTQLLDQIDAVFARTPRRVSYYPGAAERFRRLVPAAAGASPTNVLPWTLLRDVDPERRPELFREESFVCVLAETALDAPTPEAFLTAAVEFVNERLAGTLCAALTHPAGYRSSAAGEARLQAALGALKYAAVALNHWPGLMYAMMSPPWGGFPGGTLADAQSGIGHVHNTFMLAGIEKSVLEGPLTMWPKPPWFPSHARAEQVAWAYFRLYEKPSWSNAIRLALASLRG